MCCITPAAVQLYGQVKSPQNTRTYLKQPQSFLYSQRTRWHILSAGFGGFSGHPFPAWDIAVTQITWLARTAAITRKARGLAYRHMGLKKLEGSLSSFCSSYAAAVLASWQAATLAHSSMSRYNLMAIITSDHCKCQVLSASISGFQCRGELYLSQACATEVRTVHKVQCCTCCSWSQATCQLQFLSFSYHDKHFSHEMLQLQWSSCILACTQHIFCSCDLVCGLLLKLNTPHFVIAEPTLCLLQVQPIFAECIQLAMASSLSVLTPDKHRSLPQKRSTALAQRQHSAFHLASYGGSKRSSTLAACKSTAQAELPALRQHLSLS